jgi:hypothetical protein
VAWKAGPAKSAVAGDLEALARKSNGHVVVQFEALPDAAGRQTLEEAGIRLLRYLGANAYFAAVEAGDYRAAARAAGLAAAWEIETAWKLDPRLQDEASIPHARFQAPARAGMLLAESEAEAEPTEAIALYVLFHEDVDLEQAGREVIARHGGLVQSLVRSINAAVVWLPLAFTRRICWRPTPRPATASGFPRPSRTTWRWWPRSGRTFTRWIPARSTSSARERPAGPWKPSWCRRPEVLRPCLAAWSR